MSAMFSIVEPPGELLKLPDQLEKKADTSRLSTSGDAQSLLQLLVQEDMSRSYQRAIVKGCYDGNAPYNEARRRKEGMSWATNLNFLGLEGIIDSSRVPYYALFSGVPYYTCFKTGYDTQNPDNDRWNKAIEEKWTNLLDRWKQFRWHMQASQFEMLFEGWGPLIWENDASWKVRAIPARAVLVPKGAYSTVDERLPYIAVRCTYRIDELATFIQDEVSAKNRGWNLPAVRYAIKFATRGSGGSYQYRDQPWETWQQEFKNKELCASFTSADLVNCCHFYVKEYDGKISHFLVTEQPQSQAKDEEEKGFLFKDVKRFDSYDQAMVVCFQNTGDSTWHSVKGIGLKSFKFEEVKNRLDCGVVDTAFMSGRLTLQCRDAKSMDKMQLMVHGNVNYIPPGTEVVQQRFGQDMDGMLAVSRYLDNKLNNKVGHFSRNPSRDDGRGEQPTATQIEFQAANDTRLSGSQIDNYYQNLDSIYEEMFRRVLKGQDDEAKRFLRECEEAGVPREALTRMHSIKANRLSGYPSPQARTRATMDSMQLVPMMNEQGKANWLNEAIATIGGADKVGLWNPPVQIPTMDEAFATVENGTMTDGVQPKVVSGMNNVIHIQIHMAFAEEQLKPMQEQLEMGGQLDPAELQKAFEFVQILGSHVQEHLNAIGADPTRKDLVKLFTEQLRGLVAFHGKLRSAIKTVQQQSRQAAMEKEQANALGALDQAKVQSKQQDMALKQAKYENDTQIKKEKAVHQEQIKDFNATTENQRKTAVTVEGIRLDRVKTAAELQDKKVKSKVNVPKKAGSKEK